MLKSRNDVACVLFLHCKELCDIALVYVLCVVQSKLSDTCQQSVFKLFVLFH